MSLPVEEVRKVARLARLRINERDISGYVRDLSRILDLVARLAEVDTAGVPPMAHPLDASQRLREDRITEQDQRELLQRGAPQVQAGHYLVPKVIE